MYAEGVRQVPWGVKPRRAFDAAMREWWSSLRPGERWRAVIHSFCEDPTHQDSLFQLIFLYTSPQAEGLIPK